MIIEIIVGLLVIVIGVLGRIVFLDNKKIEIYEDWIANFARTIEVVDDELDKLDSEGTFRADDEVGYFFQSMYSILKRLYEYRIIINPVITGEELNEKTEENQNLFYARDREFNNRAKRRQRSDIEIEDIQRKNRKTTK